MTHFATPPDLILEPMVRVALLEDFGAFGDITTQSVIDAETRCTAEIVAREAGIVSGMQIAAIAFRLVDPELKISVQKPDGNRCEAGDSLIRVDGRATSILSAERVALNFAGRLSGIASLTAKYVAETKGTTTRITCTRKTTPGLRIAEKLAVLHGGARNHRFSLSDAIMIKDNHIAAAGGVRQALDAARQRASHMMKIEVEVDTIAQLHEILKAGGADAVLLDNMDTPSIAEAVQLTGGAMTTEASGNMSLARIAEVSATGVDFISVGALTHSARTIDLGLDF